MYRKGDAADMDRGVWKTGKLEQYRDSRVRKAWR